jgi:serine/threonine protein kinase
MDDVVRNVRTNPHENIVEILKFGWLISSLPFYFIDMELCDFNLGVYVKQISDVTSDREDLGTLASGVSVKNFWGILAHVMSGLEYMHNKSIVHRALKPSNSNHWRYPQS